MIAFLIMHVYVITTVHTVGGQLRTMITGWDDMDLDESEAEA